MAHSVLMTSSLGEFIRVPPDVMLPTEFEVSTTEPELGVDITMGVEWNSDSMEYEIRRLEVTSEGGSIDSVMLRSIAVQDTYRDAVKINALLPDGAELVIPTAAELGLLGGGDRELWAARVYTLARAHAEPPLVAVALAFGVSQSTATRIVARAKGSGLFDA